MNSHINITEEDIFRFVHSPESLPKDIVEYITNNRDRFQDDIVECSEAFNDLESDSILHHENLIDHIRNYRLIELIPSYMNAFKEDGVKLAASTVQLKSLYPISFQSSDEKYLVRIIEKESQYYLYMFCSETDKRKYMIKIFPSENSYVIDDLLHPVEVLKENLIERISIEVTY